ASAGVTNLLVALCNSSITPVQRQEHIDGVLAIQHAILDELSLDADLAVGFSDRLKAFQSLALESLRTDQQH
ncbi:lysine-sensitive aspartokinase 3, partial [Pseudoalteromonas agarivorans]